MIGTFILATVIGVFIGMLSGLLGIGGGMIMVPVFRLAFGMSALASTATSLFTIIPTSISGAVSHIRAKTCVPKLGIALGVGGACTSSLGVWLAQISPSWLVMTAAAVVIAYSASTMLRKAFKAPKQATARAASSTSATVGTTPSKNTAQASEADAAPSHDAAQAREATASTDEVRGRFDALTTRDLLASVGIGALAGVASGYVGLGGGFIMVPLLLTLFDMPMKLTSGTSLIAVMILAAPATITQCLIGNVDYLIGIAMACGSIPGAVIGAKLIRRLPERTLRFTFSGFLFVAAILLVVKEMGLLG